jgi:hypothetical protein
VRAGLKYTDARQFAERYGAVRPSGEIKSCGNSSNQPNLEKHLQASLPKMLPKISSKRAAEYVIKAVVFAATVICCGTRTDE